MKSNSDQSRAQKHHQLSDQLAQMSDSHLTSYFLEKTEPTRLGSHQVVDVGGTKIFVKRIPLTDIEFANRGSTANLYDLPMFYHYGIGSAGFNVFRELAAHLKTTQWVLNGERVTFPLLYHFRILPFIGAHEELDPAQHIRYVEYWGGNANISQYIRDRAKANHELILCLEYVPHELSAWLPENQSQIPHVLDELVNTVDFLRSNGIIHMDAHFRNVLTDGQQVYLTDFGLVLDSSFSLTENERVFFESHVLYDYGQVLSGLGSLLYSQYAQLPKPIQKELCETYHAKDAEDDFFKMLMVLAENVESLSANGLIELDGVYLDCVIKYHRILLFFIQFFMELRGNKLKDTSFDNAKLEQLLTESGVLKR